MRGPCSRQIFLQGMPIVQAEIEIAASPDDVAQSYGLRVLWDPFLREINQVRGSGSPARSDRVWVRTWTGVAMEYLNVFQTAAQRLARLTVLSPVVEQPTWARTWAGRSRSRRRDFRF